MPLARGSAMHRRGYCPHFEDSNGDCWPAPGRGVCGRPVSRGAAAFVQNADFTQLCQHNPPYGFKPLCQGKDASAEALPMLRRLRDPARCSYKSCAVVGACGTLLGARLGQEIDNHEAVIRINFAPDGMMAARTKGAPHTHAATWVADVGSRTTWRVITMEGYGYMKHYSRLWLNRPVGWGKHDNMSGIPQTPLLAVSCHQPSGRSMGRCRLDRLKQALPPAAHRGFDDLPMISRPRWLRHCRAPPPRPPLPCSPLPFRTLPWQNFDHPFSASYLINPVLIRQVTGSLLPSIRNQPTQPV